MATEHSMDLGTFSVSMTVLQRRLQGAGTVPTMEADESGDGPASLMVVDPDGNPILVDQHD